MGALFSKNKPKSRVTEQDKAVLQLKTQRDKLKQYQKKIQNNLAKERELAKTLLKDGKKDRALLLLKKKRAQENMLAKTVWIGGMMMVSDLFVKHNIALFDSNALYKRFVFSPSPPAFRTPNWTTSSNCAAAWNSRKSRPKWWKA